MKKLSKEKIDGLRETAIKKEKIQKAASDLQRLVTFFERWDDLQDWQQYQILSEAEQTLSFWGKKFAGVVGALDLLDVITDPRRQ